MKYIIMCGGEYPMWSTPRQLTKVNNETLIERTIRLLQENGVNDIYISSNNPVFENFNVPVIHHKNEFVAGVNGNWIDAFYIIKEPVCYIFGDVLFSPQAIKRIVKTPTTSIDFFASAPPFSDAYIKTWAEPFAFKVQDFNKFSESIVKFKIAESRNFFNRKPAISWELWQIITNCKLNYIDYKSYTVINDYTCDIDGILDIEKFKQKGIIKDIIKGD